MKIVLWILQILMGVFFIYVGTLHFTLPDNLPTTFGWMYELSNPVHLFSGTAEVLGGLGLILPAITRIRPQLVPLAAAGLVLLMVGAIVFHVTREEFTNVGANALWIAIGSFVAWARWRRYPISPRSG